MGGNLLHLHPYLSCCCKRIEEMVVAGKAVVFSIGVSFSVRVIPKPTHPNVSFSFSPCASSSTDNQQDTITTEEGSPKPSPSSFGRLKVQQVKALIHRTKHNSKRSTLQDDDDNHHKSSNTASAAAKRRSPSQSQSRGGWGDSVSIPNQHTKSSSSSSLPLPLADNNFFSLKSFKDIGCTDNIIQSLHNLSLTRPSHIQVSIYN